MTRANPTNQSPERRDKADGLVIVVDDDPSVCKGLKRLLRAWGHRVESYDSAESFLRGAPKEDGPCCLVLDVQMPGIDGLSLQEQLTERDGTTPVVFLTAHGDIPMSVRALKAGAADFLTKPVDEEVLLSAVHAALERHRSALAGRAAAEQLRRRFDSLTPRELDVLRCVLAGARNKQIGAYLDIAEKTVKVHRAHLMEKLGVATVADLALLCARASITPMDIS